MAFLYGPAVALVGSLASRSARSPDEAFNSAVLTGSFMFVLAGYCVAKVLKTLIVLDGGARFRVTGAVLAVGVLSYFLMCAVSAAFWWKTNPLASPMIPLAVLSVWLATVTLVARHAWFQALRDSK